jgi:hypothetical protein
MMCMSMMLTPDTGTPRVGPSPASFSSLYQRVLVDIADPRDAGQRFWRRRIEGEDEGDAGGQPYLLMSMRVDDASSNRI